MAGRLISKIDSRIALQYEQKTEQRQRWVKREVSGSRPRKNMPGDQAINPETEWLVEIGRPTPAIGECDACERGTVTSKIFGRRDSHTSYFRWESNQARVRSTTSRRCLGLANMWPSCS